MSQGPFMSPPFIVSMTLPLLLRTKRAPAVAVLGLPLVVGRLPTTTSPLRKTDRAVLSPIGPFTCPDRLAKTLALPAGEICIMVTPVPCLLAASLKLETSTSPATNFPVDAGTTATPYGLRSPLPGFPFPSDGSVEATFETVLRPPMNPLPVPPPTEVEAPAGTAAAAKPVIRSEPATAPITATRGANDNLRSVTCLSFLFAFEFACRPVVGRPMPTVGEAHHPVVRASSAGGCPSLAAVCSRRVMGT